jgi:phosphatidylserine/phosphatidylglycerophosphate/cardiolipin synthase-like enzyme
MTMTQITNLGGKLGTLFLGILVGISAVGNSSHAADKPADGLYLNSVGSPLFQLIQTASRTIDIEIYTMADPEVRTYLRDALSRHVQIRIVKDPNPLGEACNVFAAIGTPLTTGAASTADCDDQRQFVLDVRSAGGTYEPFNKSTLCPNGGGNNGTGCFEHGKIAIADQQVVMLSTGNFDSTNLCLASESEASCNRDFSIIDDNSSIVGTLEGLFNADLAGNSYDVESLIPSEVASTLTVSPYSLQPLVDFINSAQTSIDIETQYLKEPNINSALEAAAERGVRVSVTTASICAFGKPSNSDNKSTQSIYGAFDQAGISSVMFNTSNLINGRPGYLHAKVFVVDGTHAWVGSENSSTESLTENREYGLFFDTPQDVANALAQIQADHNSPNSESWQDSLNCVKDGAPIASN